MNPLTKFSAENFKEFINEIERLNKPEYLFELEDKIVRDLATIIATSSKEEAKIKILRIKKQMLKEIEAQDHIKSLLKSFQHAIEGATKTALSCL